MATERPSKIKRVVLATCGSLICCFLGLLPEPTRSQSSAPNVDLTRLKISYDKRADETTVSLLPMLVREVPGTIAVRSPSGSTKNLPRETLRMTAYFTYAGKTYHSPEQVMFGFLSLSQDEGKYENSNEVVFKVDSQPLMLGRLRVADRRVDTNLELKDVNYWQEILEVSTNSADFRRIAGARNVTVQLGNTAFDLSTAHIQSLRTLASKIQ